MIIKPGPNGALLEGCGPEILIAAIRVESLFKSRGVELVITSGTDGVHSKKRSAHYRGDGLDLRTRDLAKDKRPGLVTAMKRKLGSNFVVILESNHIHMHWSPVYE